MGILEELEQQGGSQRLSLSVRGFGKQEVATATATGTGTTTTATTTTTTTTTTESAFYFEKQSVSSHLKPGRLQKKRATVRSFVLFPCFWARASFLTFFGPRVVMRFRHPFEKVTENVIWKCWQLALSVERSLFGNFSLFFSVSLENTYFSLFLPQAANPRVIYSSLIIFLSTLLPNNG